MIKCNIKTGVVIAVNANGKLKDISNETLILIQKIYGSLKKESPEAAARFKLNILSGVVDQDGLAWKDDSLDCLDIPCDDESQPN